MPNREFGGYKPTEKPDKPERKIKVIKKLNLKLEDIESDKEQDAEMVLNLKPVDKNEQKTINREIKSSWENSIEAVRKRKAEEAAAANWLLQGLKKDSSEEKTEE